RAIGSQHPAHLPKHLHEGLDVGLGGVFQAELSRDAVVPEPIVGRAGDAAVHAVVSERDMSGVSVDEAETHRFLLVLYCASHGSPPCSWAVRFTPATTLRRTAMRVFSVR